MEIQVLHEDEHILAVNKPPGLATQPGGWQPQSPSLLASLQPAHGRLWLVHRLDRGTSGVLVFARHAAAHRTLSMLFENHQVHKCYHAIACGLPAWQETLADQPLRANAGRAHRTVVDAAAGKPALTRFRLLEALGAFSLLEALPATGRTHQVRAHAAALGLPLLGDALYGGTLTLIDRPALHAASLQFEFNGQTLHLHAPAPPDLTAALQELRAGH